MRPTDFGWALEQLRAGQRVARAGWNGKGMWLVYVENWAPDLGPTLQRQLVGTEGVIGYHPFIGMRTAQSNFVPWLASQTDILAEDWELVV